MNTEVKFVDIFTFWCIPILIMGVAIAVIFYVIPATVRNIKRKRIAKAKQRFNNLYNHPIK